MNWINVLLVLFAAILLVGIFSGCTVVKTNLSDNSAKKATVYYYLPQSVFRIRATVKVAVVYDETNKTLTGSSKVLEQSFVVTTDMIADTKNLLSLNYKANVMMSDQIKYGVNNKGLLETVNVTTEDRTAAIIAKIAEAPQIILGGSSGANKAPNIVQKIKEYTADFTILASSISSTATVIQWRIIIENELGVDETQTLIADFKVSSDDISTRSDIGTLLGNQVKKGNVNGILTRPLKNIGLKIESSSAGFVNSLPVNVSIADVAKIINIPVTRTAFVKKENKIGIQDGIIVSNEITNPSSVEGFISIPINIAKAIVSIPGQIITFRIDNTKRLGELEKEKLAFEKAVQDNTKFALTKQQELDLVKLDLQKSQLSNSIELQKLQYELNKSLIDAQTNQLKAQKDLDALKTEIEKLKKP